MLDGVKEGLTTCLLLEDKSCWFDVALQFDPPGAILGIPIDFVRDKDEIVEGLFGSTIPLKATIWTFRIYSQAAHTT